MKKCPACAEEIQDAAAKCRFCGEAQKPVLLEADITAASEEINALLSRGKRSEALSLSTQLRDRIQGAANHNDFINELAGTESAIAALGKSSPKPLLFVGGGVVVVVLIGLLFSLRGHQVNTQTRQSANSQKNVSSTPVPPPVATPLATAATNTAPIVYTPGAATPSISPEYLAAARSAFDGLRGLQSIVEVGISHQAYPTRLQDCQILVDRFIQDNPKEQIPGLREEMRQAMTAYNDANTVWGIKFDGDELQSFVTDQDPEFAAVCRNNPNLKADLASLHSEFGYHIDGAVSVLWGYAGKHVDSVHELLTRNAPK